MLPIVSIIVPTYNRAHLVIDTLDSIYVQTYNPIELLIIDDGSLDDTKRVVSAWLEKKSSRFESIQFHSFNENKGKSDAVNYGFDNVRGEFVMVFDSDDLLLKDAIAIEVNHLITHPAIDCLCAGAFLMNGNIRTSTQFHPLRDQNNIENLNSHYGDFFLNGNPIISSTVLMKKSVVEGTGHLNSVLRVTHDWDYWIRVTKKFNFGFLNVPVMYYRANADGSISQNKFTMFLEVMKVVSLYGPTYDRTTVIKTVVKQIKYHLWLAKNDRNIAQFVKIVLYGLFFFIRFSIIGK